MLVQFNPAVISIEDVKQGGFLSGGTQDVAIVERVDKERGQAIYIFGDARPQHARA